MKKFILQSGLWLVSRLELAPGVWRIGYWLGSRRAAKEYEKIQDLWGTEALRFYTRTKIQAPTLASLPGVIGMVGVNGGGKTYTARPLAVRDNAYYLDVNDIRLHLERLGQDHGNARYIAFLVAALIIRDGYNIVIDMSFDLAFARGYMEKIVELGAGDYSHTVHSSYYQNETNWEDVSLSFVYKGISEWYVVAGQKRFGGMLGVDLRMREAKRNRSRFYWPSGSMIRRHFPGFQIVNGDEVGKGIRDLTSEEKKTLDLTN